MCFASSSHEEAPCREEETSKRSLTVKQVREGFKADYLSFHKEVSPKQAVRLATAMRRMHPRGMPHRLIAE